MAFGPVAGAPGLDDLFVRLEFQDLAFELATVSGKLPARGGFDPGRCSSQRSMLAGIDEHVVEVFGRCRESSSLFENF